MPNWLKNIFQKSDINFGSLSDIRTAGSPQSVLTRRSRNIYPYSVAVYIFFPGIKVIFLLNLSIIVNKQLNPLYLVTVETDRSRIKSIIKISNGQLGEYIGWRDPYGLYRLV